MQKNTIYILIAVIVVVGVVGVWLYKYKYTAAKANTTSPSVQQHLNNFQQQHNTKQVQFENS